MNKRPNPHFSERTYLRQALEGADDIPANPSVRQMEALVGAGTGGGSGDLSIANVSVSIDRVGFQLQGAVAVDDDSVSESRGVTSGIELKVILYKGRAALFAQDDGATVSVTGAIEYESQGSAHYFTVTGDGTITVTGGGGAVA